MSVSLRRGLLLALGLGVVLAAAPAPAAAPEPAALANRAMRQAMLVERCARLYLQAGQQVLPARARRALPSLVREFDSGLRDLSASAPTSEIRENYLLLRRLWEGFAPIVARPPTSDGAKKVAERAEEIAWIALKGARLYQAQHGLARTELAMAAGEMRWRSQQIAKLHFLRPWGIGREAIGRDLPGADSAYRAAAARIREAAGSSEEIASELKMAEDQYLFLGQAAARLTAQGQAARELEFIAKTADSLAEITDRLARLVEGLRR